MIILQDSRFRTSGWIAGGWFLALFLLTVPRAGIAQTAAAIPVVERQKQIAKDLKAEYDLTRLGTVSQKQEAIKRLLGVTRGQKLSSDERYVALTTAIALAKETGDLVNWQKAVDDLIDTFAVDPRKEKAELLTELLTASKSLQHVNLAITESVELAQELSRSNQYVEARALINAAVVAVRRVGEDSLKKLVIETSNTIADQEKDWKAFQVATGILATNVDDPAANFTVGCWHVLHKDDWQTALSFLAKADEEKWKNAAQLEVKGATDSMEQAAIGDLWFDIGEANSGIRKKALLLHAGTWYETARPNLTSVLKKQVLTKRLGVIESLKVNTAGATTVAARPVVPAKTSWQGWPITAPPPAIAPFDMLQATKHQKAWAAYLNLPVVYTNGIGMRFRLIPPGEYLMGSTADEIEQFLARDGGNAYWNGLIRSQAPQHTVILTRPIYIGVHEVTQAAYEHVIGKNPSRFSPKGPGQSLVAGMDTKTHPVEMVSWNDANAFCTKLTEQERANPRTVGKNNVASPHDGIRYRLPTEAEWEFACRGGTTNGLWTGNAAWFTANSSQRTHSVGELAANPFGLFDMHGNVWEWIHDWCDTAYYAEFQAKPAINPEGPSSIRSQRVIRGGSMLVPASHCQASLRYAFDPVTPNHGIGFRVCFVAAVPVTESHEQRK